MPTVLVILPTATYRATDFVTAATDLGLDLMVASEEDHVLGGQMGDGFLAIDCSDAGRGRRCDRRTRRSQAHRRHRRLPMTRAWSWPRLQPNDSGCPTILLPPPWRRGTSR